MKAQKQGYDASEKIDIVNLLNVLPVGELLYLRNLLAKDHLSQEDVRLLKSYFQLNPQSFISAQEEYKRLLIDESLFFWEKKEPMLLYLLAS